MSSVSFIEALPLQVFSGIDPQGSTGTTHHVSFESSSLLHHQSTLLHHPFEKELFTRLTIRSLFYFDYLKVKLFLVFGFEGDIWVLIAPFPGHCILVMPPTLKKLMGHIAFGACVGGCVRGSHFLYLL